LLLGDNPDRPADPRKSHQKGGGSTPSTDEKIEFVNARLKLAFAALMTVYAVALSPVAMAGASHPTKADEQAGALLFRQQDCAHCHGPEGIGGKKAPPLTNLHKNKVWTSEKITHQILNGGQKMPPFGDSLTDPQIAQLVAYLTAKHKPTPPPLPPSAPALAPATQ
jgi:mono/diheme cytochrome c family protein